MRAGKIGRWLGLLAACAVTVWVVDALPGTSAWAQRQAGRRAAG